MTIPARYGIVLLVQRSGISETFVNCEMMYQEVRNMDAGYTGKKISECRKKIGLTQKELAGMLHVTDKAVSKWERGLNFPDISILEDLAEALQISVVELLGSGRGFQREGCF